MTGPFETEQQARDLPGVRAVHAAMHAHTGVTGAEYRQRITGMCASMITGACETAGVSLGSYDRRIIAWLGSWEPQICAVIAGLVSRARLTEDAAALVLDALEFAAEQRRYRAGTGLCGECGRAGAGICDGHAGDIIRASEYDSLGEDIRQARR